MATDIKLTNIPCMPIGKMVEDLSEAYCALISAGDQIKMIPSVKSYPLRNMLFRHRKHILRGSSFSITSSSACILTKQAEQHFSAERQDILPKQASALQAIVR